MHENQRMPHYSEIATYINLNLGGTLETLKEKGIVNRKFIRFITKHKKACMRAVFLVPSITSFSFPIDIAWATETIQVNGTVREMFSGDAKVLLFILMISFVTLVLSVYLRFTGVGAGFIPLLTFTAGVLVLLEIIKIFNKIYEAVAALLTF